MIDLDIFEPFERLVEIEICGERREVPENNTLLRCFQYLSMQTVSLADLCWNGDCGNCQIWLAEPDGKEKSALACRTKVQENMRVVRVSADIKLSDE